MKKSMFFWMAAAMALTSCSNDELVESNNGNAIDFRVAMGSGPSSRGTETTNANIGKFIVTAYDKTLDDVYFKDLYFKQKEGTTQFTSTPEYYWPGNDVLDFFAYSYSTKADKLEDGQLGAVTCTKDGYTFTGFTPASEIKNQIDFVSAKASGNKTANEKNGVDLDFGHNLSRIEIQAKSSSEAYTFKVRGIQIASVASSGDFAMNGVEGNNSWTHGSNKTSYTVTYDDDITLVTKPLNIDNSKDENENIIDGFAMLVPQQLTAWDYKTDKDNDKKGTYLAVLLQITTKGTSMQVYPKTGTETEVKTGEETKVISDYAWASVPISTNWEAGKHYIYILDFSKGAGQVPPTDPDPDDRGDDILGGPIVFNAIVKDWEKPIKENIDMKQEGTNAPATGNE